MPGIMTSAVVFGGNVASTVSVPASIFQELEIAPVGAAKFALAQDSPGPGTGW